AVTKHFDEALVGNAIVSLKVPSGCAVEWGTEALYRPVNATSAHRNATAAVDGALRCHVAAFSGRGADCRLRPRPTGPDTPESPGLAFSLAAGPPGRAAPFRRRSNRF